MFEKLGNMEHERNSRTKHIEAKTLGKSLLIVGFVALLVKFLIIMGIATLGTLLFGALGFGAISVQVYWLTIVAVWVLGFLLGK